jgi:hypothetical protein
MTVLEEIVETTSFPSDYDIILRECLLRAVLLENDSMQPDHQISHAARLFASILLLNDYGHSNGQGFCELHAIVVLVRSIFHFPESVAIDTIQFVQQNNLSRLPQEARAFYELALAMCNTYLAAITIQKSLLTFQRLIETESDANNTVSVLDLMIDVSSDQAWQSSVMETQALAKDNCEEWRKIQTLIARGRIETQRF